MRCADCLFWNDGECHRYAPRPYCDMIFSDDDPIYVCWPPTLADDFCGDWRPLPVDPAFSNRKE